ncbi:MAG: hypothetical protein E7220_05150 [Clostridiales bacterium]|nr:hypothetical protein [Clostridiales bacterium]
MKKKLLVLLLGFVMIFAVTACGGSDQAEPEDTSNEAETAAEETTEPAAAPEDIVVDSDAGTVTITAQVNGMFFDQSTMHCVVNKDGGVGDKAMFAAYCDSQKFYDALVEAGGEPWNTTTDKLASGEFTDGQKVDITLKWDGQDEPVALADALKTDDGRPEVDMRFSGNKDNNAEAGSGCIACLNSCWAGITSNAAYGFDAIDSGNPLVYLDDSVVPADGTDVQITFTLK